jgi:hypothetical protein
MTMTAAFFPESYPILMGDVLLSGPEVLDKQVHIPTIGNVDSVFPKGSGFTIVGLCQKLCILNDKLAVGWSGTRIAAWSVIKKLMEASSLHDFALDDVIYFWEHEVDKWYKENVSIIGLIKNGDVINSFGFNIHNLHSERFGHVILSGSGSHAMADCLSRLGPSPEYPSSTNILERAVATALTISTDMLGQELISPQGLLNYFGGGIELVSLVKGRFTKIGDITYLFWYVSEDGKRGITFSLPETALKFAYYQDCMLVRKAEFKPETGPLQLKCDDSAVHIIASIMRPFDGSTVGSIPIPSFNSRWTCHYVVIRKSDNTFKLRFIVDYVANQDYKFHFIEENNLITRLHVSEEFLHRLHAVVTAEAE